MMSPPPAVAQADDAVAVQAARFYREDGNQTRVRAFVQVPLSLMTPTVPGPQGIMSYRILVAVRDSSGLTLHEDAWPRQHLSAGLREPGAFTVNMMEFNVLPGSYELEVTVEDSVSGLSSRATAEILGYGEQPMASDLLLSPMIRPVTGDSVPSASEWRAGQVMVTSIADLKLTPLRSTLYYYLEAYSDSTATGKMGMVVRDTAGKVLLNRPPGTVQLGRGGGILMGDLNLEGLPGGEYELEVSLAFGQDTAVRVARFEMAGLAETIERDMERKRAMRATDQGYFELVPEDSLDILEDPLVYLAESGELKPYSGLSVQGKRNFLTQFWQKRDPDPSTPRNEVREQFYGAIAYAEKAFGEPGSSRPGWKTPRGEVWARYGRPDEQLERIRVGNAPTYEVWRYTRVRDRYFIFADRTGVGNYVLLHSNDLELRGLATWRDILTEDGVRDVGMFLGIDFYTGFSGTTQ